MYIRIVSLLLAFCLGFAACAGSIFFGVLTAAKNFRVRDLERNNIIQLPDEAIFGDDPVVDLLDLSILEFIDEFNEVKGFGDKLTIETLRERYAIKIHHDVDKLLSEEVKNTPLPQLFSAEGFNKILGSVYIGHCQNYVCHAIDSDQEADPALGSDLTRWYDPVACKYVTGINGTIAYFNLADFAGGGIHVDSVLNGIVLADVLGYTFEVNENGKKIWYDGNGTKVSGVMAVFADCSIDEVGTKINSVAIGDLIGYELGDDGVWYELDEVSGEMKPVSPFMTKIAQSSINNIGGVFKTFEIGDIVDEEEREKGIFSIIPANTRIDEIDSVVNSSITGSPMQFFMNQGMISFDVTQQNTLDDLCIAQGRVEKYKAGEEGFERFTKYYDGKAEWTVDADGYYLVPAWRDQALSNAFSYIVGLLIPPSIPDIPDVDIPTDEND